jgi:Fis family transcriptional regulator
MKNEFEPLVERLLSGNILMEEAIGILEKTMIQAALQRNGGKQTAASKQLGIHRNTLQRKMVEFGLDNGRTRRKPVSRASRTRKRRMGAA